MTIVRETNLPNLMHRGKVRDMYDLGDYLLMVATDRISAFDVVLPNGVPNKGSMLAQMSVFWFEETSHIIKNHMVGHKPAEQLRDKTIEVYKFARDYALKKGIIIADTKFEFGYIGSELCLIDELLTPDSSRFWDSNGFKVGVSQPSYDKQIVRDW